MTVIVASSMGLADKTDACRAIFNESATTVPELDVDIKEADVRIIPISMEYVVGQPEYFLYPMIEMS